MIEICCGSAGLCAAFEANNMESLGIDWGLNRHTPKSKWITINLAEEKGLTQVMELISGCKNLLLIWFGLPCGTASRARETVQGPTMPPQLRSAQRPFGLPGLSEVNQKKVEAANNIYLNAIVLIKWCIANGKYWCVENPSNSYLWYMQEYIELLWHPAVRDLCYSACMVGGKRDKKQRLRTNAHEFLAFLTDLKCDGSHQHAPWSSGSGPGQWHTTDEAEYPAEFCSKIAQAFRHVQSTAAVPAAAELQAVGAMAAAKRPKRRTDLHHKRAVGSQPGSWRTARLIPEYKVEKIIHLHHEDVRVVTEATASNKGWINEDLVLKQGCIPAGSRLLKSTGDDWQGDEEKGRLRAQGTARYGTPWEPMEFVRAARALKHPFDEPPTVADRQRRAIFKILTKGVDQVRTDRKEAMAYWTERAAALEPLEIELFKNAHPAVQACWGNAPTPNEATRDGWKGKRTLLLQEMAEAAGAPRAARAVCSYVQQGVPVFGEVPATGLYDREVSEPDKTLTQVLQAGKWSRPALRAKIKGDKNPEADALVLARTEEEVQEGKALGPYTEDDVDRILGKQWAPARRVGLVQSAGIRPIDDFSEFGHNGASKTHEKVDLATVDVCAGMLKLAHGAAKDGGTVAVELNDGQVLEGKLHESFRGDDDRGMVGRTIDLRRAFKQLAPAPAMAPLMVVALWHPGVQAVRYYLLRALPFGARNAVYTFGATARVIEHILVELFWLITAQYVDDYPQVEYEQLAEGGADTMAEVLELLGWDIKKQDGATPKFGKAFTLLGVTMDLAEVQYGTVRVANKPERAKKICQEVERLVAQGRASLQDIEALRGALNFARAQCFGRCGAAALHFLSTACRAGGIQVVGIAAEVLRFWPRFFEVAKPRTLRFQDLRPPVLIFTDGSEEEGRVGVGGVIMDDVEIGVEYFGGLVADSLVEAWKATGGKRRVIHQAEVYPATVALQLWGNRIVGRRVLLFVDNDAAKECLIRGASMSKASASLVSDFWCAAVEHDLFVWIDRVASASNTADAPSREECPELDKSGAVHRGVLEFQVRPFV